MSLPKIDKETLKAELHVIGKVEKIDLKKDENQLEILELRIKYSRTTIFLYERKPIFLGRMKKYQVGDVLEIMGNFVSEWYPGAKNALPVINNVLKVKKLGTLKK